MLEQITLGIIQGITEWLPVSSEGLLILVKTRFFADGSPIEILIKQVLLLHFGTFLAALVYFRNDVNQLLKALIHYRTIDLETQKIFQFLLIATVISGLLGFFLVKSLTGLIHQAYFSGKMITFIVGLLLLITAFFELKAKKSGSKDAKDLTVLDGILLGIAQGWSALPGLSRSGLTISVLLLRKFDKTQALRLSFLMSLPIVLGGNIILHWGEFTFVIESLWGLLSSFVFGLATIHLLLKLAQKINFGYFVLGFGILTICSIFI